MSTSTITTRRKALQGAVALAAGMPAVAIAGFGGDAELLALTERFDPLFAKWLAVLRDIHLDSRDFNRLVERATGIKLKDAPKFDVQCQYWETRDELLKTGNPFVRFGTEGDDEAYSRLTDALCSVADEILAHPASTPAGVALQARAIMSTDLETWSLDYISGKPDNPQLLNFMAGVCALVGVPFPPIAEDPDDHDPPPFCGAVGATALRAPAVERMAHADIGINLQPGIPLPLTDPAVLPAQYAMKVEGTCMSPLIKEGTEVVFSKAAEIMPGAIVVVWRRPERIPLGERQAIIKRLAGPGVLTELIPYVRGPITNVTPLLFLRCLNPPGCMVVGYDDILAVHACLGTVAKKPRQPGRGR